MYTFALTMCGLIALLGTMAIIATRILDGIIEDDKETDYGKE